MTYSTHYGDLLKRQAELQTLGKMPMPNVATIRTAAITEVGELAQEVKPDWAWWSKPNATRTITPERVLSEAADVLHFTLLMHLVMKPAEMLTGELRAWINPRPGHEYTAADCIASMARTLTDGYIGVQFVGSALCTLVSLYGFTPADLARAYWEKSEENLRRWREAREGQA